MLRTELNSKKGMLEPFYLSYWRQTYGKVPHRYEKGNLLPPHGLLFPIVLLYAPSHRQDFTYHGLCYTSRGALAGTRNSSMGKRPRSQWLFILPMVVCGAMFRVATRSQFQQHSFSKYHFRTTCLSLLVTMPCVLYLQIVKNNIYLSIV